MLRDIPAFSLAELLQYCALIGDAMPAVLCRKDPASRIQSPLLGTCGGYFTCSSLVLYGIRIVGFYARKGPIIGAKENSG